LKIKDKFDPLHKSRLFFSPEKLTCIFLLKWIIGNGRSEFEKIA